MGNNRVVYADGNNNGVIEPTEILEENNYYPFGLEHQNYSTITGNTGYKYTFGGKEFQPEKDLNMYDFGARNYDPALGRWMNIDPLAEKFTNVNPYNYVYNNPIVFRDPDGKKVIAADIESQNLILNTLLELLGKNHGFSFNKKGELYHKNSKDHKNAKSNYSEEKNNIYKGFLEIMQDKEKTISFTSQSGDDTSYNPTFMIDSYEFRMKDGIAQKDSEGNFIKDKVKLPLSFTVNHSVVGETGGGAFLTTTETDNYAVSIVFPDIAKNRRYKALNGYTTPSLSGIVVHELLDHGIDFIRTGNNNKSKSSSVNNVNYQNDALKIINSQTRIGHDSH